MLQVHLAIPAKMTPSTLAGVLLLARAGSAMLIGAGVRAPLSVSVRMNVDYGGMAHAGVLCADMEASFAFYRDVLGMDDDTPLRNPKLPFSGAFLRAGAQQIHLMELPNPDPTTGRPQHGGRDRHLALTIRDLSPLKERLEEAGVVYTMSKSGRAALFCRDIDGNALEFIEDATGSAHDRASGINLGAVPKA